MAYHTPERNAAQVVRQSSDAEGEEAEECPLGIGLNT